MGKIVLTDKEIEFVENGFPNLKYSSEDNSISGNLEFDLRYTGNKRIKDCYTIYFKLETTEGSILPSVYETKGRILKIAKRKKVNPSDIHLFNSKDQLCIIHPLRVKEKYPEGFNLKTFLQHIQEHLYWVTYYDRYNIAPWPGQSHGEKGYIELYCQNPKAFSHDVKTFYNSLFHKSLTRPEFRRLMKLKKTMYNL